MLHGEMARHGTRNPAPIGQLGSPATWTNSPGVPAGGVGGGTWSNRPSFSSYWRIITVLAHTSGLAAKAAMMDDTKAAPWAGEAPGSAGCSEAPLGGQIHETVASWSCRASYSNCPISERVMPRS